MAALEAAAVSTPTMPRSPSGVTITDEMWRAGYKALKATRERGEDDKIVAHQVIRAALTAAPSSAAPFDATADHLGRQDQALIAIADSLSQTTAAQVRSVLGKA